MKALNELSKRYKTSKKRKYSKGVSKTVITEDNHVNIDSSTENKFKISDVKVNIPTWERGNEKKLLLNGLKIGVGNYNRAGRQIEIHKLKLKTILERNNTRYIIPDHSVRIIIVYDKQTNGVAPPLANICFSLDQDGNPFVTQQDLKGQTVLDRFEIVYDQDFEWPSTDISNGGLGVQGTTNSGQPSFYQYLTLKFNPPLKTKYFTSNDGTVGDIESGSLLAYVFSDLIVEDDNPFTNYVGLIRLYFKDIK